jgi:hypothetical protein
MLDKLKNILFPVGLIFIALNGLGPVANVLGYGCLFLSIALTMMQKRLYYGKWYVWALLSVIVLLCVFRNTGTVSAYFACLIPLVYFAALNVDRKQLGNAFGAASLVASLSIIVLFIIGRVGGGIVDSTNYNLATGVIILGALLATKSLRWILLTISVPSLVLAGSEEAIFALGVIAVVSLIRKDTGRKAIPIIGTVVVVVIMLVAFQKPITMYSRVFPQITDPSVTTLTNGRADSYSGALSDIQLFGHGYDPRTMSYDSIHNVPLMILYQIGPFGLAAFLLILLLTLLKTKDKYLMIGLGSLMAFDHYLWTQLFSWSWAVVGISQRGEESDNIWKEADYVTVTKVEPVAELQRG